MGILVVDPPHVKAKAILRSWRTLDKLSEEVRESYQQAGSQSLHRRGAANVSMSLLSQVVAPTALRIMNTSSGKMVVFLQEVLR